MVGLCRLCASLKKPELLISIKDNTQEICERIHKCCDVEIQMQDAMPKDICLSCIEKLNLSYDFYTKVQEAQETLKEFLPSEDAAVKPEIALDARRSAQSTSNEVECIDAGRTKSYKNENNDAKHQQKLKVDEDVVSSRNEISTTIKKEQSPTKRELRGQTILQQNVEYAVEEHLEQDEDVTIINAADLNDDPCDDAGDKGYLQEVYNILGLTPDDAEGESPFEQQLESDNILATFCNKENEDHVTAQAHGGDYLEQEEEMVEMVVEQCDDAQIEVDQDEMEQEATQEYFEVETIEMDDNLLVYNKHDRDDGKEEKYKPTESAVSITSWKFISYLCVVCNGQNPSFYDLVQHAVDMHSITDINQLRYKCNDCQSVLSNYSDFVNHIRLQHHCELVLRCDACDKPCKDYKQYKLHRDLQCPERTKYPIVYTCSICAQAFRSHTCRQVHMRHHLDNKKFTCKICTSSFPSKEALMVHENKHKSNKHMFPCDKCDKFYISQPALDAHKKKHTGKNIYQCDICNKRFKAQIYMDKHKTVHTKERPFNCSFCPRQFRTKIEQTTHERVHTGEMPLQCTQCEKRFRFRSALAAHLKTHSGVRKYACTFCERRFNDISNYKKHLRRKHFEESEELQYFRR